MTHKTMIYKTMTPQEIETYLTRRGFRPDQTMVAEVARALPLLGDIQRQLRGNLRYADGLVRAQDGSDWRTQDG